jgi:hypothetical protein
MTQEPTNRPSTSKRNTRGGRNRPVLVTSTDAAAQEQEASTPIEEAAPEATATPKAPRPSRLPSFFSTVGKSKKTQDADAAQARLARATRGKTPTATSEVSRASEASDTPQKAEAKEPARAKSSTAAPARPASPFKMRYILGMVLYLVLADVLGLLERNILLQNRLEGQLTQFTLFGNKITIYVSTVVFMVTLVAVLILLARFDLIPRNLGAMSGQAQNQGKKSQNTSGGSASSNKAAPPTMKQGVQGADDDLYQEYRARQRREKKR